MPPNPHEVSIPDLSDWKKHKIKVSLGTLAIVLIVLFGMHRYVESHVGNLFMSVAMAEDLTAKVEQALAKSSENSTLLLNYIRNQDLKDARASQQQLQGSLQDTLLWEAANNGENDISRARKTDLQAAIQAYTIYISCLESGRETCDL